MTDRELDARLGELIGLDVHRDTPCWWYIPEGRMVVFIGEDTICVEPEGTEHAYRPHPEKYPTQLTNSPTTPPT